MAIVRHMSQSNIGHQSTMGPAAIIDCPSECEFIGIHNRPLDPQPERPYGLTESRFSRARNPHHNIYMQASLINRNYKFGQSRSTIQLHSRMVVEICTSSPNDNGIANRLDKSTIQIDLYLWYLDSALTIQPSNGSP